MRIGNTFTWGLATLSLAVFATPALAQQEDDLQTVAHRYLTTVYTYDFEGLAGLLSEDAVFSDPTAVPLAGTALSYSGRDAIVASFEAGSEGTRNAGYEIEREFASGEYVVMSLVYTTELSGDLLGRPGEWLPIRVSGVTVLRIQDGLVTEHVDHVDYDTLLRQIAAFTGSPRQ